MTEMETAKRVMEVLADQCCTLLGRYHWIYAMILEGEYALPHTGAPRKYPADQMETVIRKAAQPLLDRIVVYADAYMRFLEFTGLGHAQNGGTGISDVLECMEEKNRKETEKHEADSRKHTCDNSPRFSAKDHFEDLVRTRALLEAAEKCRKKERYYAAVRDIVLEAEKWDGKKKEMPQDTDEKAFARSVLASEKEMVKERLNSSTNEEFKTIAFIQDAKVLGYAYRQLDRKLEAIGKRTSHLLRELDVYKKVETSVTEHMDKLPSSVVNQDLQYLNMQICRYQEKLKKYTNAANDRHLPNEERESNMILAEDSLAQLALLHEQSSVLCRIMCLLTRAEQQGMAISCCTPSGQGTKTETPAEPCRTDD